MAESKKLAEDLENIYLGNLYTVEANLSLPDKGENGTEFTWVSEHDHIINRFGHVTRPRNGTGDRTVRLTVHGTLGGQQQSRLFDVTVLESGAADKIAKTLPAHFRLTREKLAAIPSFGIAADEEGRLSVHRVRWRLPQAEITADQGTLTLKGTAAHQKDMDLLDMKNAAVFFAQVDLIEEDPLTVSEPAKPELTALPVASVEIHEGRLATNKHAMASYLQSVDSDQILYNFRFTVGLDTKGAKPMTGWDAPDSKLRGHTSGHYLSAIAYLTATTKNPAEKEAVKNKVNYIVDALLEVQNSFQEQGLANDGYLGSYQEEQFDLLEEFITYPNIWAPYYTLHKLVAGLLDAYVLAGSTNALLICNRLMEWLDLRFSKLSKQTLTHMWAMYIAGEYGGMNDVIARYISISGNDKLIGLAKAFDNDKLFYPLSENSDALYKMHANQHIPQVIGALQIFRITGDRYYWDVAWNFWQIATENHCYTIGGIGEGEMFKPSRSTGRYITLHTAEGCASYNMLKLTKDLFEHRPQADLMDYYERTTLNHIAPSLESGTNSGGSTYFMPLAGGSQLEFDLTENSCCHGTGMENHLRYEEAMYHYVKPDRNQTQCPTLYINLHFQSSVNWTDGGIRLRQVLDFSRDQAAEYLFESNIDLNVMIRIPGWLKYNTTVTVNGSEAHQAKRGEYLCLSRNWKEGDRIHIALPFDINYFHAHDDENLFSVLYGPYIMAAQTADCRTIEIPDKERFQSEIHFDGPLSFSWRDLRFQAHYLTDGSPFHIYLRKSRDA